MMVALLVAAVLWQAPAAMRVPNGERRTIEAPAVTPPARLVFRVRPGTAGRTGLLAITPLAVIGVDASDLGPVTDVVTIPVTSR